MALSTLAQTNLSVPTASDVFLAFPPDTACFSAARADKNHIVKASCPTTVTPEMVAFLNLTSGPDNSNYITAYCNNPPSDDTCPFGYCAQPDIAGILVRVATYVTNFALTLLVFYGAEDIEDTFYTTLLQLYSILVTAILTVTKNGLTKLHAVTALLMVASPVTVYILVYSLRNVLGSRTRLDDLIGHGKIMQKTLIMAGMTLWFGLVVFTFLPSSLKHFSQPTCESPLAFQNINFFIFSPIKFVAQALLHQGETVVVVPSVLFILAVLASVASFAFGFVKHRNTWNTSRTSITRKLILAWRVVKVEYPFVHFMLIILLPTVYWVAAVEIGLIGSNDQQFQLSFGQILATFVAVPPVISCLKLSPQCLHWLMNLSWVRAITGRPKRPWKQMNEEEPANTINVSLPVKQASIGYGPGTFEDIRTSYEKPAISMA